MAAVSHRKMKHLSLVEGQGAPSVFLELWVSQQQYMAAFQG
ncbi:mCG147791 [Mus musculus]|nr:mCG147791 [Mus musculus]